MRLITHYLTLPILVSSSWPDSHLSCLIICRFSTKIRFGYRGTVYLFHRYKHSRFIILDTVLIIPFLLPDWIRQRALSLELRFILWSSFLEKTPLLRYLHRNVTADIDIVGRDDSVAMGIRVRFITPYLNPPAVVEKMQIGSENEDHRFTPTAFRFFDWHSWGHIEGKIDC